ncbi:MAG: DAK2 domain-containing protein [Mariniphaga sp.]
MNKLTIDQFRAMLGAALTAVREKEEYFSQLDAVTGDGDHGTAIVTALNEAIAASGAASDFNAMFNDIGFGVMLKTSGSTSTLMGGFFLGMADGSAGVEIDAAQVKVMFRSGLEGVAKNTKATIGDKTMMDALLPAVEAISLCSSEDIREILSAGAAAALLGAAATVQMKANFGRARNYGDRSIGTMDAGAASWATMFGAFSKSLE